MLTQETGAGHTKNQLLTTGQCREAASHHLLRFSVRGIKSSPVGEFCPPSVPLFVVARVRPDRPWRGCCRRGRADGAGTEEDQAQTAGEGASDAGNEGEEDDDQPADAEPLDFSAITASRRA
jgi:hypothetical protein